MLNHVNPVKSCNPPVNEYLAIKAAGEGGCGVED